MFTGAAAGSGSTGSMPGTGGAQRPDAEGMFGDVFEDVRVDIISHSTVFLMPLSLLATTTRG